MVTAVFLCIARLVESAIQATRTSLLAHYFVEIDEGKTFKKEKSLQFQPLTPLNKA